ncbi:serine protease HtrA [Alkaliphilus hydrothermalis]|uniref:S1-C subfamily serine protease n=1 Tax=Alkaliphilus hydrothermalis TaxID=1482730 RepID=A0ABS2NRM9_9FIRM|nr:trypsin-like peptidase domain-containing protein [Alkaliphilus hydrothermalis]MBM7615537.1 S1-C subfamily serine protease [Alkaliphilus hydrothermalis]
MGYDNNDDIQNKESYLKKQDEEIDEQVENQVTNQVTDKFNSGNGMDSTSVEGGHHYQYEQTKREVRKKNPSKLRYLALVLAGAILGSGITMGLTYTFLPDILAHRGVYLGGGGGQSVVIEPNQDISVYSAVAKKAMPSVVGVTTLSAQRDFFGRQTPGLGTGVIVDSRGYILTNSHVVMDGNVEEIAVILYDGDRLPAKVVWQDSNLDLAVIKVEAANLPVAELGDSDQLIVGEIAVAIGNPLGLNFERTLTQGVVSGLNRSIPVSQQQTIEDLIQTDASINPGNSGGPLLNAKGQVIGINTAKIQSGEGLGFAIPINTAKPIVEQIIEKGEFTRVLIGIRGLNVQAYESATGLDIQAEHGIYIGEIIADSPADKYGMMVGDVIIKIGENEVKTMGNLQKELYKYRPGDEVAVTVIRNGKEQVINITFEE